MFGWEFPPHIAGGLGTACYGMTRGLAHNGVDVTFVVPHAYGDEDQRFLHIVNASDVEALYGSTASGEDDILSRMSFIHIDSNMVPYISPEEYDEYHEEYVKSGKKVWESTDAWKQRYTFSGKYGANLMEEVARYAVVAAQVARDLEGQFDVIHAHDWLTYYAGIAAKRVSGKPLVVHMHATEFDRSGENINTQVYAIERAGMMAADRVIAVSNLTRNIVITRYGIPADKVVTVHNAVRFAENNTEAPERGVKDKIVTFLGRITYQEGPDYFVEAAAKVLKRVPDVRFVMAGSGDMMNHVIRRVARPTASTSRASCAARMSTRCSSSRTSTSCLRSRSPSASRPWRRCARTSRSSSPSRAVWPRCSTTPSRWTTGTSTPWPTPSTPSSSTRHWRTCSPRRASRRSPTSSGTTQRPKSRPSTRPRLTTRNNQKQPL